MERKYLKWTSLVAIGLLLLGILGALVYFLIPSMFEILAGDPTDNACDMIFEKNHTLTNVCIAADTSLGGLIMVLILLSRTIASISVIPTTIDIFTSLAMPTSRKVLWLAGLWLLLGFGIFVALAYVIIEKND